MIKLPFFKKLCSPCRDCITFPICKNKLQKAIDLIKPHYGSISTVVHLILTDKCSIYYESTKKDNLVVPKTAERMARLTCKLMEINSDKK